MRLALSPALDKTVGHSTAQAYNDFTFPDDDSIRPAFN